MSPQNKDIKLNLIKQVLQDVKKKKKEHYKKYVKLNNINTMLKTFVAVLNTISVCSLVLSFFPLSIVCQIISLSSTSISAIISSVVSAYELEHKLHSNQTSYLQYTDVLRDMSARIYRNGLSSEDLDYMLSEINSRLGLIEDTSPALDGEDYGSTSSKKVIIHTDV
jgi:magnesium-transporting ATPase (P-type)